MEEQKTLNSQSYLGQMNIARDITVPDVKMYHKANQNNMVLAKTNKAITSTTKTDT